MKALIPLGSLPSPELHSVFTTAFMTALPLSASQQSSEAEGPRNSDEALSIAEPWPRALGRGLYHPGLGLYAWFFPLVLERWCWPQLREEKSAWVLLLEWKRLWRKVSKDEQHVVHLSTETVKFCESEPHDAKKEETARHCTQRISGWRLPKWGLRKTNPGN